MNRLRPLYLGVDSARYGPAASEKESVASEFGLPVNGAVLGFFGRLIEWKGHFVFLNAMARLRGANVHALIVGGTQLNEREGDSYVSRLKQHSIDLGLADRIRFTGFRKDIPRLMAACDIVCHASKREPFGLVLVEAMHCGKPVIASDDMGPREIVVPGKTGFLFPEGDAQAMAGCIQRFLDDPGLGIRMGEAGRERALEFFELQRNLEALNTEVEAFVREGGR